MFRLGIPKTSALFLLRLRSGTLLVILCIYVSLCMVAFVLALHSVLKISRSQPAICRSRYRFYFGLIITTTDTPYSFLSPHQPLNVPHRLTYLEPQSANPLLFPVIEATVLAFAGFMPNPGQESTLFCKHVRMHVIRTGTSHTTSWPHCACLVYQSKYPASFHHHHHSSKPVSKNYS